MWNKVDNTIRLKKDVKDSEGVYIFAAKEYPVKREEKADKPGTINIVIDSEVEDIEIIINVDAETGESVEPYFSSDLFYDIDSEEEFCSSELLN